MISSALIELNQSKTELFDLMDKQSHALLQSLIVASQNILRSNQYLENTYKDRLLNNAAIIRELYEKKQISNSFLAKIASTNNIYRINIFDPAGKKIYSNHQQIHNYEEGLHDPLKSLAPIFNDQTDTLILGIRPARFEEGYRYAVALASKNNSAIVLNVEAGQMIQTRQQIGFGQLLKAIVQENPDIKYAVLQDSLNVLAGAGNFESIETLSLQKQYADSAFFTRIVNADSVEYYEAIHPFSFAGFNVGLFRIGLSLESIDSINQRIYRRLIIITIILSSIGFLMIAFVFIRQRFDILQSRYYEIETYSGSIIQNVNDAIIVYDQNNIIKIFNLAAERLFGKRQSDAEKKSLDFIFESDSCGKILKDPSTLMQMECELNNSIHHLVISKQLFKTQNSEQNIILVIRDITNQKRLEMQLQRQERLTAMGELAAGVAHEIRNPLNAISTIIQQLKKDFKPQNYQSEYDELTGLINNEVKRINFTIEDFLKFARPQPPAKSPFSVTDFFYELHRQYNAVCKEKNIEFILDLNWQGDVNWDKSQIKQVFINLIQNAIDALEKDGKF